MNAAELLTRTADRVETEGVLKGYYSSVFNLESVLLAPPEVVEALLEGDAPCGGVKFCLIGSLWAEFGEPGVTIWEDYPTPGLVKVLHAEQEIRCRPLERRPVLRAAFDALNSAAEFYIQAHDPVFNKYEGGDSSAGDPDVVYYSKAEYLFEHGDLELDDVVALVRSAADLVKVPA